MSEASSLIVDVYYNGTFRPKPLVYFDPDRASVQDVDFREMEFSQFIAFLEKLTKKECKDVYYCLPDESLSQGLGVIQNEGDYREFTERGYGSQGKRINVYTDYLNAPVLDWIELKNPDEVADDGNHEEEDVDSRLFDTFPDDHIEDELVPFRMQHADPFLNALCPPTTDDIEEDDDDDDDDEVFQKPVYPIHDSTQDWDKMVPLLGMRFSNPDELKICLSNYAVKHGYDLWYEKSDKKRLLVKCSKGTTYKCPFRLWATWMSDEESFQIKSLIDTHNCSRTSKLGSIVSYQWIGKHFVNEIMERPKMSVAEMKAQVSKKFNINVSLSQCRNAKKFALGEKTSGQVLGKRKASECITKLALRRKVVPENGRSP